MLLEIFNIKGLNSSISFSLEYASFYWYDEQYNEAIETYFYDSNINLQETLEAIGVKGDFFEYGDKKKISISKKLSEEFYY